MNPGHYTLLLVIPRQTYKHYSMQIGMARMAGKANTMPSLALALVAALTPPHYTITIVDEEIDTIPTSRRFDIVGITAFSNTIDRACAIADTFRSRGSVVVMGGAQVTFAPEDALLHADAVVLGEAEGAWPRLLADYERGALRTTYRNNGPVPFTTSPPPRWDLVRTSRYLSLPVQATRGCPFNCEFCLVTKMFGRKKRMRSVDDIISEIQSLPSKRLFFVDDNLTVNKPFARELVGRLQELGISWVCQSSIDITDDDELLETMAQSGCHQILIGFESLNQENLDETQKRHNSVERFAAAIERIHRHGIHVLASFIVGFDNDTLATFDTIHTFCLHHNVPYVILNTLACSPGSDLHRRMAAAGRLCEVDAPYRDGMFPTITYRHMTRTELFAGYLAAVRREFSYPVIYRKGVALFSSGWFRRERSDPQLSPLRKGVMFVRLVCIFMLTPDRDKRRTFNALFSLFLRKQAAIESVVVYLMSMEGFHRYVGWLCRREKKLLSAIAAFKPLPPCTDDPRLQE